MDLLFGGCIEDGTYFISDFFFKLFGNFSQHITCYMDLASLSLGMSKFFIEDGSRPGNQSMTPKRTSSVFRPLCLRSLKNSLQLEADFCRFEDPGLS